MTSRAGGTRSGPRGLPLSTAAAAPRMPPHVNGVSRPQRNRARGSRQMGNWPLLADGGSAPSTVYTNVNRVSSCRMRVLKESIANSMILRKGHPRAELAQDASQLRRAEMGRERRERCERDRSGSFFGAFVHEPVWPKEHSSVKPRAILPWERFTDELVSDDKGRARPRSVPSSARSRTPLARGCEASAKHPAAVAGLSEARGCEAS